MKRRVDLLVCLRCGHEPLERHGPLARCSDCGRAYPLRRPGLVDFLPQLEDDERRTTRLINPKHWWLKSRQIYRSRLAPPDQQLHDIISHNCGGIILHLSCGSGSLLEELARHPWRLRIGVDRKLSRLLRAHRLPGAGANLLLIRSSPYRIPVREKTIDTALLQNPFVEFKDHQAAIYEIVRLLKPDGRLICRVEAKQEDQLRQTLSTAGFAYYRVGNWWVSRRIETQSEDLTEHAL